MLDSQLREIGICKGRASRDAIFIQLGGLKPEGSAGKAVESSKDTALLRDSTMLEADSDAPTAEDVTRRKQMEVEAKTKLQMKTLNPVPVTSSAKPRRLS